MKAVDDYPDKEFFCIDDNSKESGTKEYLEELSECGWTIINQQDIRSQQGYEKENQSDDDSTHINPLSDAFNIFLARSTGDYLLPLQGDIEFIRRGWLQSYVDLYEKRKDVGTISLDAQRRVRLNSSVFEKVGDFAIDIGRKNINGAGDCMYSRELLESVGGWKTDGTTNAEDNFSEEVRALNKRWYCPWTPVAVGIYTDPRGTNARVRGDKRYGKYFRAEDDKYYKWVALEELPERILYPHSIEDVAIPNGWDPPLDEYGNWMKNPIDIGSANREDYEVIR